MGTNPQAVQPSHYIQVDEDPERVHVPQAYHDDEDVGDVDDENQVEKRDKKARLIGLLRELGGAKTLVFLRFSHKNTKTQTNKVLKTWIGNKFKYKSMKYYQLYTLSTKIHKWTLFA